eukprot:scaffold187605_cov15-Tisochrysis_lutea.AAC.1
MESVQATAGPHCSCGGCDCVWFQAFVNEDREGSSMALNNKPSICPPIAFVNEEHEAAPWPSPVSCSFAHQLVIRVPASKFVNDEAQAFVYKECGGSSVAFNNKLERLCNELTAMSASAFVNEEREGSSVALTNELQRLRNELAAMRASMQA